MTAFFLPIVAFAAEEFVPLAPLPGVDTSSPESFFNSAFRFGVVIAAFLAVFMIVIGGFKYMTTEAVSGKGDAKDQITSALAGLFLVLLSVTLLQIINPDILKINLFRNAEQLGDTPRYSVPKETRASVPKETRASVPAEVSGWFVGYTPSGTNEKFKYGPYEYRDGCRNKEASLRKDGFTINFECGTILVRRK